MIGHLFSFDIGESVSCQACRKEVRRETVDYFLRLNVTLGMSQEDIAGLNSSPRMFCRRPSAAPPCNLKDLIRTFLRAESVDDYRCEGCGLKGKVQKRTRITRFPNVLVIYVDRNQNLGMWGKVNRDMTCPAVLQFGDMK